MLVSERIKHYMKLKDIKTTVQLSKLSGVPNTTLVDILKEETDPRLGTMAKIIKGLGVTQKEFYDGLDDSSEVLAANRGDGYDDDLPEEAIKSIEDFKNYVRNKYGKKM